MKKLYTIAFLLLTTLAYCQKSTLLQNVNTRAKELKHKLNHTGDSLILKCERTIYKVEIFNRDFEKSYMVRGSEVKIPLREIPVGRFVIEAVLPDRLIVITLLRNEIINAPTSKPKPARRKVSLFGDTTLASNETPATTPKGSVKDSRLAAIDKKEASKAKTLAAKNKKIADIKKARTEKTSKRVKPSKVEEAIVAVESTVIDINRSANTSKSTNGKKSEQVNSDNSRPVQSYWIVYETRSNGNGSGKQKRFGDQALVNKMISHINLDKRTIAGRNNKLTVWEIYDVSAFLKHKMRNSDDLSNEAECFNSVPFYETGKNTSEPKP